MFNFNKIAAELFKFSQEDIDPKLKRQKMLGDDPFKFLKTQYKKEYSDLLKSKSRDELIEKFNNSLGRFINYINRIRFPEDLEKEQMDIIINRSKIFQSLNDFTDLKNKVHALMICAYKAKSIFNTYAYENTLNLINYDLVRAAEICKELYNKFRIISARKMHDLLYDTTEHDLTIDVQEIDGLFNDIINNINEIENNPNYVFSSITKERLIDMKNTLTNNINNIKRILNDIK